MLSGAMSPSHWLLVLLAVVILFGAKKLPEAARGLGRSARILKAEVNGMREDESAQPGTASIGTAPGGTASIGAASTDTAPSGTAQPGAAATGTASTEPRPPAGA